MKFRLTANFVAFGIGLCLTSVGAYWVFPPAGLIIPGLILMAISVFGGHKE